MYMFLCGDPTGEYRACLQYLVVCSHAAVSYLAGGKTVGQRGPECYITCQKGGDSLLQTSHVTVEVVLIFGNGTRTDVLPESAVLPCVRQSAASVSIGSHKLWVVKSEHGTTIGLRSS